MSQACLRCFLATPILCNFARSAGIENNCFLNSAAFIALRTKIKTILRIQEREGGWMGGWMDGPPLPITTIFRSEVSLKQTSFC